MTPLLAYLQASTVAVASLQGDAHDFKTDSGVAQCDHQRLEAFGAAGVHKVPVFEVKSLTWHSSETSVQEVGSLSNEGVPVLMIVWISQGHMHGGISPTSSSSTFSWALREG